jgi:hypothetical protein
MKSLIYKRISFKKIAIIISIALLTLISIPFIINGFYTIELMANNAYEDAKYSKEESQIFFYGLTPTDGITSINIYKDISKFRDFDASETDLRKRCLSHIKIIDKNLINKINNFFSSGEKKYKTFPRSQTYCVYHIIILNKNGDQSYIKLLIFNRNNNMYDAWCNCFGTQTYIKCKNFVNAAIFFEHDLMSLAPDR